MNPYDSVSLKLALIQLPIMLIAAIPFVSYTGTSTIIFSSFFVPLVIFAFYAAQAAIGIVLARIENRNQFGKQTILFGVGTSIFGAFALIAFMCSHVLSGNTGFNWLPGFLVYAVAIITPTVILANTAIDNTTRNDAMFSRKNNSHEVVYAKKRFISVLSLSVLSYVAMALYANLTSMPVYWLVMLMVIISFATILNLSRVVLPVIRATIAFNEYEVDPELKELFAEISFFNRGEQNSIYYNKRYYTTKITQTIAELELLSEQISPVGQQIKEDLENLEVSCADHVKIVHALTAKIEKMHSSLVQNYRSARFAKKISEKAVETVNRMTAASNESMAAIELIVEKIKVINEIAHQTNIISLNAAMEAARVGEAGRGFAVVATQVRKLAEHSRVASDEIIRLSRLTVESTAKTQALAKNLAPEVQNTASLLRDVTISSEEQGSKEQGLELRDSIERLNSIIEKTREGFAALKTSGWHIEEQSRLLGNVAANLADSKNPPLYKRDKPEVTRNLMLADNDLNMAENKSRTWDNDFAKNDFDIF